MATKKRAPLRVEADPRPEPAPPKPKPAPEPRVSVYVHSLPPGMSVPADSRLVFVSEADATCSAAKRHAKVWAVDSTWQTPPRPPGTAVAHIKAGDDPVAKILAAAEG